MHNETSDWVRTTVTNGIVLSAGIITGIIAARCLNAEGRGLLAEIQFWPQMTASLLGFGIPEALTYYASRSDEGVRSEARLKAGVKFSFLLIIAGIVLAFVSRKSRTGQMGDPLLIAIAAYNVLFISMNQLTLTALAFLLGKKKIAAYNQIRMVQPAAYLALSLGLLLWGRANLTTILLASLLSAILVALITVNHVSDALRCKVRGVRILLVLREGLPYHVMNIAAALAINVDKYLLIQSGSAVVLGLYVVCYTVGNSGLSVLSNTFHTLTFPTIAAMEESEKAMQALKLTFANAGAVLALSTAALAVVAPVIIAVLFGSSYYPACYPSVSIVISIGLYHFRAICGKGLRGIGVTKVAVISDLIYAVAMVGLYYGGRAPVSLHRFGVICIVANLVSAVYCLRQVCLLSNTSLVDLGRQSLLRATAILRGLASRGSTIFGSA